MTPCISMSAKEMADMHARSHKLAESLRKVIDTDLLLAVDGLLDETNPQTRDVKLIGLVDSAEAKRASETAQTDGQTT